MKMGGKKGGGKGGGGGYSSSKSGLELNGIPLDYRSIMKEVEHLGSTSMTWKEKKDLQNKKVVSLGGKAPKQQRRPLSVARLMMKNQKKREEKMLQHELLIGQCGENLLKRAKKPEEKRKPAGSILKSSEGRFRNGVLDVKHLLKAAPLPRDDDRGPPMARAIGSRGKKKKGGKKKGGKRKGGGKRH
ncbi:uncharacterized protein LOC130817943 [Amaranthus tricolor]|uniref:uncharacterized protein LOC130817943 n=1 Tax=Amaranthus tricolor TaxID=29722 RepID=UPI00258BAE00|nr:uncharacterized protein LOC130817943 [Amaranthus tricolor]XP_057539913.1 uncharacterized protein LOC130817943 [Amaranthus tricolor]